MCLILFEPKPEIATEDIICYKTGRLAGNVRDVLISEIAEFKYTFYETYDNGIPDPADAPITKIQGANIVAAGLFHSYASTSSIGNIYKRAIVKCVIPKGAYYFTGGVNSYFIRGYASSKIRVESIISYPRFFS